MCCRFCGDGCECGIVSLFSFHEQGSLCGHGASGWIDGRDGQRLTGVVGFGDSVAAESVGHDVGIVSVESAVAFLGSDDNRAHLFATFLCFVDERTTIVCVVKACGAVETIVIIDNTIT